MLQLCLELEDVHQGGMSPFYLAGEDRFSANVLENEEIGVWNDPHRAVETPQGDVGLGCQGQELPVDL